MVKTNKKSAKLTPPPPRSNLSRGHACGLCGSTYNVTADDDDPASSYPGKLWLCSHCWNDRHRDDNDPD